MIVTPSYDLSQIKALVGRGAYHITQSAMRTAQDVYRPRFDGRALYVKLQLATAVNGDQAVVISFKAL